MANNIAISDKKKALLKYKEKLLNDIKYYKHRIEDIRGNTAAKYYDESCSSDSEDDFPTYIDISPSVTQLKQQQHMLRTCLHATEELTALQVLQSEFTIVKDPQLNGEAPVEEEGSWREVTAECRIDLVPFSIMFYVHTPRRTFGPLSYRGLKVLAGKTSHEAELNNSVLCTASTPSDAIQVLRSYAFACRSRRTTLSKLSHKYAARLNIEPLDEGGYLLQCANLLKITWRLESKTTTVATFQHKLNIELDYMEESYIKIISQAHKSLSDPSITTDERTLLLAKIMSTCVQAKPMGDDSIETDDTTDERQFEEKSDKNLDEESDKTNDKKINKTDRESVRYKRQIDQKSVNNRLEEGPVAKKKKHTKESQNTELNIMMNKATDDEIMAPPKSLPKKVKPKGKENADNRKSVKRTQVDDGGSGKRAKVDENMPNKESLAKDNENLAKNDKNTANNDRKKANNDKILAKNDEIGKKNAIEKNKEQFSITQMVADKSAKNDAKTKPTKDLGQSKHKVPEKTSNINEQDKIKKNKESKDVANTKNTKNNSEGKVASSKNDLATNNSNEDKILSVKEASKNVASKDKGVSKNDAKKDAKTVANAKNDNQKTVNAQTKVDKKGEEIRNNDKVKIMNENRNNIKNKDNKKLKEPNTVNKENQNKNAETANIDKNIAKNLAKKLPSNKQNLNTETQKKADITKPLTNKRIIEITPANAHESPKRSPRLLKVQNATSSIEKATVKNVAIINKASTANIASTNKPKNVNSRKIIKNLSHKNPSAQNILRRTSTGNTEKLKSGNIKNLKVGNISKENGVSKIPQMKVNAISENALRRNHLRISSRKMASSFIRSFSDSNIKKIQKPVTNIPRLMKKPTLQK